MARVIVIAIARANQRIRPMDERKPYPLLHVNREHALFDDSEASFVVAWHKRKNADDFEYIPRAQANDGIAELIAAVRRDQAARHERAILIPEQETEWPSGYDFEALEAADAEEIAADESLEALLVKLEKAAAERKARVE